MERESWSGKWAFILAAAGSAVGLGNMWRFPYLAAKYGGGTFLLIYIILVFTLGVSLLLQDITLGRKTKQSAIGAFGTFGKKYRVIGVVAAAVPFLILPYYCIIGGWVAKYAVGYITVGAETLADGGVFFSSFITSPFESYFWLFLFALIVLVVVALGVKGGIEKINLVLMPALILLALGVTIYTFTIPGALDGVAYYLTPDLSKISPELLLAAIGQCFFSLSIAMCIMITYGSYVKDDENITQSVNRIAGFDLLVSLLAGFMIIPGAVAALGSAEAVSASSGPSLMFITLPTVFEHMGAAAPVIGTLFFLLALFAAVTSAISIAEACVSIVQDSLHLSRLKASLAILIYALVVGSFVNAGYNVLSGIEPLGAGSSLLDLFDFLSNSVLMPVVAIATCIFVGWIIKPKMLIAEVEKSGRFALAKPWTIMVKYIAPVLIVVVLVAYVAAQFGIISM
ncbi:MAG: sodium-dependent transporter [Coriobacteriia bacterium]|nr:sodium-dependent transporter [Coriobacteriia bacterium]